MNIKKRVILASGSPRRKELLEMIGIDFEVISGNQEENYKSTEPVEIVKELALMKARYVADKVKMESQEEFLVIGADTIVVLDGKVIEKPKDKIEAFEMLQKLQGRSHLVYTGVAILDYSYNQEEKAANFAVETKVNIDSITPEEIEGYIDTGEPFDKAGGYGIQGEFAVFVKGIEGEYYNVMGLPLASLYQNLKELYEVVA